MKLIVKEILTYLILFIIALCLITCVSYPLIKRDFAFLYATENKEKINIEESERIFVIEHKRVNNNIVSIIEIDCWRYLVTEKGGLLKLEDCD